MSPCENCQCGKKDTSHAKNESVWVDTATLPTFPPLAHDATCDVLVIGAGITGLTAALELVEAGKKVIVVEASKIGTGVTGYTTAHVTSIIDTRFKDLTKKLGHNKAALLAESGKASIAKIAANVARYHIDCDWHYVPGYLYSEEASEVEALQAEAQAATALGVPATFTAEVPLPFATAGAAAFTEQAEFHPLKYLQGLVAAITDAGGIIHEATRVTDVANGTPCVITTNHGTIRANDVIMATHTPITKMLLVQSKVEAYRSYVLGVKIKDALAEGIYWDTAEPYHYLRSYNTPEGPLLIVGGEDHKTGITTDAEKRYAALACYVKERFPESEIVYRWSAQVFESIDLLPYIGRAPSAKHVYVATGYAGNGMTFGTVAGMMLPQLILTGAHAWEKLYRPSRVSLAPDALHRMFKIGMSNARHFLLDRFTRAEGTDVAAVRPGEGKLLQLNGKKVAVYKDTQGNVTQLSPVCTHAGCIVAWNNAEKTWDCPCHGGRYSPAGKVINGPPIKDLAQLA